MINLKCFSKKKSHADIHTIGALGESCAVKHLKKNKYKIVGTNIHAGHSEIDIIALKDETLIFIEVKTRLQREASPLIKTRPANAVNHEKRAYLIRGINRFCNENHDRFGFFSKRLDVIEVYFIERNARIVLDDLKHFENI